MTSREHARRLMLILLSSQGEPGADAPDRAATECENDGSARDARDEPSDADGRRMSLVEALTWT